MKTQIEHKGKIFKYMMYCFGYYLYSCGNRRILVNVLGHVIHEYDLVEKVAL